VKQGGNVTRMIPQTEIQSKSAGSRKASITPMRRAGMAYKARHPDSDREVA